MSNDDFILETESLTKEFAGFVAVNGVSLRIARGTIHALIGPNGAGKTTCFNLLTKFLRPTAGRIAALIKRVAVDRTVLMVEHNLSVVADLCHRITVLTRGRVLAEGDYRSVSDNPAVREAYLGVGHA